MQRKHKISLWSEIENLQDIKLVACNPQLFVPIALPLEEHIKEGLYRSIRGRKLLENPSNIIVKGDSGKMYCLKIRPTYGSVPLCQYTEYNELHEMFYDYKELAGAFIIIDNKQFNLNGKELLKAL